MFRDALFHFEPLFIFSYFRLRRNYYSCFSLIIVAVLSYMKGRTTLCSARNAVSEKGEGKVQSVASREPNGSTLASNCCSVDKDDVSRSSRLDYINIRLYMAVYRIIQRQTHIHLLPPLCVHRIVVICSHTIMYNCRRK